MLVPQLDDSTEDKELLKDEVNWYDNVEEASLRLVNSVVLYDGAPVYVTKVAQNQQAFGDNLIRVYFYTLPIVREGRNHEYRRVISSPKFDFKPFQLGLFDHGTSLWYLSRGAQRRYQQGLTQNNIGFRFAAGSGDGNLTFDKLLYSQQFVDLILGRKYPKISEVSKASDPWNPSCAAISRCFGVVGETNGSMSLVYGPSGQVVGRVEGDKLVLNPKFEYLRERLDVEVQH